MSLLTQVQRRPGSGTILQKFINFDGVDEGASVEQSFELLVKPALEAARAHYVGEASTSGPVYTFGIYRGDSMSSSASAGSPPISPRRGARAATTRSSSSEAGASTTTSRRS